MISATYFNRWVFSFRYDPEYFENYYYHSQWNIPESPRTISDDDLYKFVGYRLVNGENPFNLNYEVPPGAKYLYGLTTKFLGNPYLFSYALYLTSLGMVFLVANLIFRRLRLALLSTLVFSLNPLLVSQIGQTMLDLPQTVFWLIHVYFFIRGIRSNRIPTFIAAGVFLGLMTGTKIGVYSPFLFLVDISTMVFLRKNIKLILVFLISCGGGYGLAYLGYFMHHPNPIPWIRLHKQVVVFYLRSKVMPELFNQLRTILVNQYHGWWDPSRVIISTEWSVLIPAGFISLIFAISQIKNKFKTNKALYFLAITGLIFILINSFVPFWMRYLVIVLPCFSILIVHVTNRKKWPLCLVLALSLFSLFNFYCPTVDSTAEQTAGYMKIHSYPELYRLLSLGSRQQISEKHFIEVISGVNSNFDRTEAKVENIYYSSFVLKLTYTSPIGVITYKPIISLTSEKNQWRIKWNWSDLLPEFNDQLQVKTTVGEIAIKEIYTKDKVLIATIGNWPDVSVIPQEIGDWGVSLKGLVKVNGLTMNENWAVIRKVVPDIFPVNLGHILLNANQKDLETITKLPGITIKSSPYLVPVEKYRNTSSLLIYLDRWLSLHRDYILSTESIELVKDRVVITRLLENNNRLADKVYLDKNLAELLN